MCEKGAERNAKKLCCDPPQFGSKSRKQHFNNSDPRPDPKLKKMLFLENCTTKKNFS